MQQTAVLITTVILVALVTLSFGGCDRQQAEPLLCYVGGTMRPAIEEIANLYEKKTGQKVNIDYAGSGELFIKIKMTGRGDLYVCHDPFLGALAREGFCQKAWTVASLKPMIAVAKENPKSIHGIKDLARPGLRLGLSDEFYSTCGYINKVMFRKSGIHGLVEKNIVTRTRGGGEAANAVCIGNIDATIVWNAVIHLRRDKLDPVEIEPEFHPHPQIDAVTCATFGAIDMSNIRVTIATLRCSRQPKKAKGFAELAASPKGERIFSKHGFSPAPRAEKNKELYLYCGAGLQPMILEIVNNFTAETGVKVICDYAGSEILLSRIKLAKRGDLYMPGDVSYIEQLEKDGLVTSKEMVCYFIPVILVRKGNPKGIDTVSDFIRPGIRLGLGNPEACAIGRKSMKIFEKNGIDEELISKNLVFSSMTVNELGIHIKTGKLDAAIVWDAIAAYYSETADVVAIPKERNVISKVAIGLLSFTKNRKLAKDFMEYLTCENGKDILEKHQYTTVLQD